MKKFRLNLNRNTYSFKKNAFEIVCRELAAILSEPQYVNCSEFKSSGLEANNQKEVSSRGN